MKKEARRQPQAGRAAARCKDRREKKGSLLLSLLLVGFVVLCKPEDYHHETVTGYIWILAVIILALLALGKIAKFMDSGSSTVESTAFVPPMSTGRTVSTNADARRAADQRVWERTKALNEAAFHQYYANKNRDSYAGYQAQNRADAARERAKRL